MFIAANKTCMRLDSFKAVLMDEFIERLRIITVLDFINCVTSANVNCVHIHVSFMYGLDFETWDPLIL